MCLVDLRLSSAQHSVRRLSANSTHLSSHAALRCGLWAVAGSTPGPPSALSREPRSESHWGRTPRSLGSHVHVTRRRLVLIEGATSLRGVRSCGRLQVPLRGRRQHTCVSPLWRLRDAWLSVRAWELEAGGAALCMLGMRAGYGVTVTLWARVRVTKWIGIVNLLRPLPGPVPGGSSQNCHHRPPSPCPRRRRCRKKDANSVQRFRTGFETKEFPFL